MSILPQMQKIAEEKRRSLQELEEATQQMLQCPAEELPELVRSRQKQVNRLEKLDRELQELCRGEPEGRLYLDVLQGRADAGRLPEGCLVLHREGLKIREVLSRFKESDTQAVMRLEQERKAILKQIKATNKGVSAKASRFSPHRGQRNSGSRLGKA